MFIIIFTNYLYYLYNDEIINVIYYQKILFIILENTVEQRK